MGIRNCRECHIWTVDQRSAYVPASQRSQSYPANIKIISYVEGCKLTTKTTLLYMIFETLKSLFTAVECLKIDQQVCSFCQNLILRTHGMGHSSIFLESKQQQKTNLKNAKRQLSDLIISNTYLQVDVFTISHQLPNATKSLMNGSTQVGRQVGRTSGTAALNFCLFSV